MSDRMYPISIEVLTRRILTEFNTNSTIFGVNRHSFFYPENHSNLIFTRYGQSLESPLGVAAGPQTQLAQNIISAWLTGSRYIELKTVQTLDELEVSKPCIDMRDIGFNCEWSQELRLHESYDEYLKAWILIHLIRQKFGLKSNGDGFGAIFNMSVGYNFDGIQNDNVQTFLQLMKDSSQRKKDYIERIKKIAPEISGIEISDRISDNITLSTMHGCPPEEIEKIGMYLLEELGVHTTIKLNPTLNGPSDVRDILNNRFGFKNVVVPDIAFEHDLKWNDGIRIIQNLKNKAGSLGLDFSVKLTNTLECMNNGKNFDTKNEMMYMSGRSLHALAINLAHKLQEQFNGELDLSFSAGVDAFNIADVLACNIKPVTVCTDLLKPGGYERMAQYFENIDSRMEGLCASNYRELVLKTAGESDLKKALVKNLGSYRDRVLGNRHYHQSAFPWETIKTKRKLTMFDCVKAPCQETCPAGQDIPTYMYCLSEKKFDEGLAIIKSTNPFPNTTGMACDHICQDKCTRMNYDNTLLIREIKRFLAFREQKSNNLESIETLDKNVAIIGAGPCGLSAAFYLAARGFNVELFESSDVEGGMAARVLPDFRSITERVMLDIDRIKSMGVKIYKNYPIDTGDKFMEICAGFQYVIISTGASECRKMSIEGETSDGVVDFLSFLMDVKSGKIKGLPKKVAVIGGGNSAIDTARSAKRLMDKDGELFLIYRRTIDQMPADREEIKELMEENIRVLELVAPVSVHAEEGKLKALECIKMELGEADESGRRKPVPVAGSNFTIDLDLLISAIGQEKNVTPFTNGIEKSLDGGLAYDFDTLETSMKNVFIGGDSARGPLSIIQAVADGRKIACTIAKREGIDPVTTSVFQKNLSLEDIRRKRARRVYGKGTSRLEVLERDGFDMVTKTMSEKEAKDEADRCLYCDELCEVCVTVCPNRANVSYRMNPREFRLQDIIIEGGRVSYGLSYTFELSQQNQVLNIGDMCNECGNCATFCPTAGKPYMDKPKIYLTRKSFTEASDNAFFFEKSDEANIIYMKTSKENVKIVAPHEGDVIFVENKLARFKVGKNDLAMIQMDEVKKSGSINMLEIAAIWALSDVFGRELDYLF